MKKRGCVLHPLTQKTWQKGSETKMQAVIGFVLGIVTVIVIREYEVCKPMAHRCKTKTQQQIDREYENFLSYDGEEQR